jgi:magnesium-transporting ATPase (P-type)
VKRKENNILSGGENQKDREMAPPETEGQVEPGRPQQQQQQQQRGGFSQMLTGVIRMAVFWYFASKFFSPKRPSSTEPSQLISNIFQKAEPLVIRPFIFILLLHSFSVVYVLCDLYPRLYSLIYEFFAEKSTNICVGIHMIKF